jgi:hypothetical protein
MPTLIACLLAGKGTWAEVNKIIQAQKWDHIYLITNDFGRDNFTSKPENAEFVLINTFKGTEDIIETIKKQLHSKITDFEVALNLASGTGKEHMAILESVLELGLNFRLVTIDKENKINVLGLKY